MQKKNTTTLETINDNKRISFTYFPSVTDKLRNLLKSYKIEMAFSSKTQLKNLLGSTKDKKPMLEKSGVYLANCNVPECDKVYVGKTKRPLKVRMKEHLNDIKNNKIEKSGLAEHIIESGHNVCEDNFKLLKEVQQYRRLDITESMYIYMYKDCSMNREDGNVFSSLYQIV